MPQGIVAENVFPLFEDNNLFSEYLMLLFLLLCFLILKEPSKIVADDTFFFFFYFYQSFEKIRLDLAEDSHAKASLIFSEKQ